MYVRNGASSNSADNPPQLGGGRWPPAVRGSHESAWIVGNGMRNEQEAIDGCCNRSTEGSTQHKYWSLILVHITAPKSLIIIIIIITIIIISYSQPCNSYNINTNKKYN